MAAMKIHYLQHVSFEDPGAILSWGMRNVHTMSRTRFFHGESLPASHDYDLLLVMGGPMSVHDEKKYPWLADEKKFIHGAIATDKKVIGICLGAQLIADVLGAEVRKNKVPEIGWFSVTRTEFSDGSPFGMIPASFTAFHWHGDTFDIPVGAIRLAESEFCENQAFIYRKNILAIQFHLESTPQGIEQLIKNCPDDLIKSKSVQQPATILDESGDHSGGCHDLMYGILERFTE
jgi:GMP synthase-like glutamine amidotransferase